jgi:hypothetical protein
MLINVKSGGKWRIFMKKRNFAPGHEDEDWFAAEDSVNRCMY